jgi:hypothetical protein
MPSRYPVDVRRQVVELARSGTKVARSVPERIEARRRTIVLCLSPLTRPSPRK